MSLSHLGQVPKHRFCSKRNTPHFYAGFIVVTFREENLNRNKFLPHLDLEFREFQRAVTDDFQCDAPSEFIAFVIALGYSRARVNCASRNRVEWPPSQPPLTHRSQERCVQIWTDFSIAPRYKLLISRSHFSLQG